LKFIIPTLSRGSLHRKVLQTNEEPFQFSNKNGFKEATHGREKVKCAKVKLKSWSQQKHALFLIQLFLIHRVDAYICVKRETTPPD